MEHTAAIFANGKDGEWFRGGGKHKVGITSVSIKLMNELYRSQVVEICVISGW